MNSSGIWIIIPVKPFEKAKSRLATVLDVNSRISLCSLMLEDVISAVKKSDEISGWGIVSRDEKILQLAREQGGVGIKESVPGLNPSLTLASQDLEQRGATGTLVIPMDIPLITAKDIDYMIQEAFETRGVVIVPSQKGDGTNALLMRPALAMEYAFGVDSSKAHETLAKNHNLSLKVCQIDNVALDIDLLEDLIVLAAKKPGRYAKFLPDDLRSNPNSFRRVGAGYAKH